MTPFLLAQAGESIWPNVVDALGSNGLWVFLAVCILAGTAKHIAGLILQHRERMAMIDAGMTPDKDADLDPEATVHYTKKHG